MVSNHTAPAQVKERPALACSWVGFADKKWVADFSKRTMLSGMKMLFFSCCMAVYFISGARADITLVTEMSADGYKEKTTMQIATGKMRFDAGDGSTLLFPKEDKMVILIHPSKEFMIMRGRQSHREVPAGTAATDAGDKGSKENQETKPKISRTDKKENINGFDCYLVVIEYHDHAKDHLWLSKQGPSLSDLAEAAGDQLFSMGEQLASSWMKWADKDSDLLLSYPIRQISFNPGGEETSRTTLLSCHKNPIEEGTFAPPPDYKEHKMPDFSPDDMDAELLKKKSEEIGGMASELEKQLKAMDVPLPP